jgi:Flp pilus assembly protein TadD
MTPETPSDSASVTPEPPRPPASAAPPRRGLWVWFGAALALAGVAAGAWWWLRPMPPAIPAVPADIQDPEVVQDLERARKRVSDEPHSAAAWGDLGMALLAYQYFEDADRCFAEAERLDPSVARWPYYRYAIASWLDPTHALPFLQRAAEIGSPAPEEQSTLRLQLADALLERRQFAEAERLYREELRLKRAMPRVALGLGMTALARGDEPAAVRFLTEARASPYAGKKATAQLAALARAGGRDDDAEHYEKEAAALHDDQEWPNAFSQALAQSRVGRARERQDVARLEREGRYEEAAAVHLGRIEREPTEARHHVGAGLDLARAGQYDRALPLLREAARLDPDNCVPHQHLAETLYAAAQEERKRSEESPRAREWFREAAGAARRAAEQKRDHADAYLIWGRSLMCLKEWDAAVDPLRRGVACRPEVFDLQLALGEALLEAKNRKEAETYLENARKLDPKDSRLIEALERLRQKGG